MTKVYVTIIGFNWEGYASPVGVFSTLEKAKEHLETKLLDQGDYQDIFELTLDDGTDDCWDRDALVSRKRR